MYIYRSTVPSECLHTKNTRIRRPIQHLGTKWAHQPIYIKYIYIYIHQMPQSTTHGASSAPPPTPPSGGGGPSPPAPGGGGPPPASPSCPGRQSSGHQRSIHCCSPYYGPPWWWHPHTLLQKILVLDTRPYALRHLL
jgi:hypothetical protein